MGPVPTTPEPEVRPWTWGWLVACLVARGVLATAVCLGLWGALPAVLGWSPTTVSSGSMLPRLHVGDVAVSRPLHGAAPTLGSVLLFDDPDHPDRLRLHRFVRVDDEGRLVTRGDANPGDDSSPVTLAAVRGVGTLRVPWVGLPVVWFRERAWLPLGLAALALAGLTAVAAQGRRFGAAPPGPPDDDPSDDRPGTPNGVDPADPDPRPAAARPPGPGGAVLRPAGALAVAGLLLGLAAVPAGAVFTGTTANAGNRLAASTYFRCASAVTATSPSLWFRMDETSSTTTVALDSSAAARNGVYGAAGKTSTTDRACPRDTGRAMVFDGSSGYLSSAALSGAAPNTFTVGIWFRTTTARGGKLIGLGNAQTGASGIYDRHLYLTDAGRVVFGVYNGAVRTVTSPAAYRDGGWHQAVATLSSAGMRLYLDGELVASDTATTTAEAVSGGYLRIGFDNLDGWPSTPTSRYFAGTLDEATFSTTALTAAQVAAQHEAGT
ncbi:LamG-like jellyroll fold domain-containing protein [Microlunatus capsulatus]|uniref:Signal peptidase I n=1 Tax=Microlunatus capsulatus TaxID=99117 RepID=A0ABS4Z8W1_9ACTN|nr:LamG-like jellyroll fold domain-containing protein [Microlunatus capsulatus]MBP2417404.1 signal peptidase I [Microlunatus capsulatus]